MNATADAIAATIDDLTDDDQEWVRIATIRAQVDASDNEFTEALLEMVKTGFVHLVASANRKVLTDEDHAAAIRIGDEDKHLVCVEAEYYED